MMFFSCGKSGSDSIPREAFSTQVEGTLLKKTPDEKSESISIIPFGTKITLSDKSPSAGNVLWYKTKWQGSDAWINSNSVSDIKGLAELIAGNFTRDREFVKEENRKLFVVENSEGIKSYTYTGGEMEPAEMTFLPAGGMILNSKIFSEKYTNYYFTYQFLNEGRLLKITFVDSRLNFSDYIEVESGSASVFKIDRNEGSITYHVKNKAFYFMNWGFVSRD
jgi:hypothetical protein